MVVGKGVSGSVASGTWMGAGYGISSVVGSLTGAAEATGSSCGFGPASS